MNLDRSVSVLNSYEGRDKLSKTLQFAARFMKWHYLENNVNKEKAKHYGDLSTNLANARKLFSLFKSLAEMDKIVKLLQKTSLFEVIFF